MTIGTRILKLQGPNVVTEIPVTVSQPAQENDGVWFCAYEIGWPEGAWRSRAGGIDALQAVYLALQMIGTDIYTSSYHQSGQLFLDTPGKGYGFPVPVTLRHLLVGDDANYF